MATILDRIERTALGGDVVKALRMCISLGGQARSAELREWAIQELHGYDGVPSLPDYRRIRGPLYIDAVDASRQVRGQQITSSQLPDVAKEYISEEIEIRHSIPTLQSLVESTERTNEPIHFAPSGAAEVAALMSGGPYGPQVMRLYWAVDASTLRGVTERVCTDVIAMVNEMRAGMEPGQELPSPELANQVVGVVIHGNANRVVLKNVAQSQNSSTIGNDDAGSLLRKLWWIVGILGTLGGLVYGYIQLVA